MTKTEAISIFGTRQQDLADAVGVTRSAVAQWPESLPQRQIDIVVGAAVRLGKPIPSTCKGIASLGVSPIQEHAA
jgi:transcriptional regulator with XRE-family HTH domain